MKKYLTNKLTDADVRAAKPQAKTHRLLDGGGLYCEILSTGTKVWRWRYFFGESKLNKHGKLVKPEKTLTIGTYPKTSLSEARKQWGIAKEKLNAGTDPAQEKQIIKRASTENSFQGIAEEWFEANKSGWAESHSSRVISYLKRDAFPFIGKRG